MEQDALTEALIRRVVRAEEDGDTFVSSESLRQLPYPWAEVRRATRSLAASSRTRGRARFMSC